MWTHTHTHTQYFSIFSNSRIQNTHKLKNHFNFQFLKPVQVEDDCRLQANCTLSDVMKKQEPPNTMKHPWLLKSCIYEELCKANPYSYSTVSYRASLPFQHAVQVRYRSRAVPCLFPPTLSLTDRDSVHSDTLSSSGQFHVVQFLALCQLLACVCIEPSTTASSIVPIRTSSHCEALAPTV